MCELAIERPPIVRIVEKSAATRPEGIGLGCFVFHEGSHYVLTAFHVCQVQAYTQAAEAAPESSARISGGSGWQVVDVPEAKGINLVFSKTHAESSRYSLRGATALQERGYLVAARQAVRELDDQEVAGRATRVLDELETELSTLDTRAFPPVYAAITDTGALALEWFLPQRRVGLVVDKTAHNSSWFLTSKHSQGVHAFGGLLEDYASFIRTELQKASRPLRG